MGTHSIPLVDNNAGANWAPSKSNWGLINASLSNDVFKTAHPMEMSDIDLVQTNEGLNVDLINMEVTQQLAWGYHPEWVDYVTGQSRFSFTNWPIVSGRTDLTPQPSTYYQRNHGHLGDHGTGTLSAAGGRLYGFAKRATLHAISTQYWSIEDCLDMIKKFHQTKTDKTRPTVLCLNIEAGFYLRNDCSSYSLFEVDCPFNTYHSTSLGFSANTLQLLPSRIGFDLDVGYTDTNTGVVYNLATTGGGYMSALVTALTNAGVIVTLPAGNNSKYIAANGDVAYYNYVRDKGNYRHPLNRHYFYSPDAIMVGAMNSVPSNGSYEKASYSSWGSAIDVFAAGYDCWVAGLTTDAFPYPLDSTYYSQRFSGTSLANPLVAGYAACVASSMTSPAPSQVKSTVVSNARNYLTKYGHNTTVKVMRNHLASVQKDGVTI
jgi:subtilisin family serine protease